MSIEPSQMASLITAFVGIGSLIFAVVKLSGDRSEKGRGQTFESRDAMRSFYRQTAIEIMDAAANYIEAEDQTKRDESYLKLNQLYLGKSRLLPNPKGMSISEDFSKLMDRVWTYEVSDDDSFDTGKWNKLSEYTARLYETLQVMLNEQHDIHGGTTVSIKERSAREKS